METDYEKMYNNLTVLLQDICQFLNGDKLGSLSHRDKKLVESLITRSKVQLQEISKIQNTLDPKTSTCERNSISEEYVDMDAKKAFEEDDEKLDIYSSVDDINKNVDNIKLVTEAYPYDDLPAKEASQVVKYGFMYMRRRFLLGFEKMKRVYGAIHNKWFLVYYTEKDLRPICTFNLKNYEARESDGPKSTNFELQNNLDRKMYYFMALTPKDMLQWIANINRCHDNVVVRSKEMDLETNEEDFGEHYDTVITTSVNRNEESKEEDEDDIYLELDDIKQPIQNNNTMPAKGKEYSPNVGPPLPIRRPQKEDIGVVSPPSIITSNFSHSSEESLASYDDIAELQKTFDQSTDDEDATYEAFVHVKSKITKMSNPLPTEEKEIKETTEHSERNEIVITKNEVTQPKKQNTVVSLKDKIQKFQILTIKNDGETDAEKRSSKNIDPSLQGGIKKSPNINADVKTENNGSETKKSESASSPTKNVKGAIGLNPPVIKKVPAVPLKPKIRDKPSISQRPPLTSYMHIGDNR